VSLGTDGVDIAVFHFIRRFDVDRGAELNLKKRPVLFGMANYSVGQPFFRMAGP